jgi:hypothetical protein
MYNIYLSTTVYFCNMAELIDPSTLQTVHNFAAAYNGGKGVTPSYIYRLIREKKLASRTIDGTVFVVLPAPTTAS